MRIIAVITARSGSKSIPQKNIRNLGGIPLLGWVVKAVSNSTLVQKIILSTDSEEYFKIANSFNNNILFHKRTPELAEDVPTELILLDVIKKMEGSFDNDSIVVLIQPTTPFITGKNIDECIRKIINNPKMNTCISVKQISERPEWMITKLSDKEDAGVCKDISGEIGIRQNLTKRWLPNGGIYVIRKPFLEKEKKCIDNETLIYEMSKITSLDIDEEEDFTICQSLVNSGIIHPEK
jgi:N-acylneuraminate cytidylyltransferase